MFDGSFAEFLGHRVDGGEWKFTEACDTDATCMPHSLVESHLGEGARYGV